MHSQETYSSHVAPCAIGSSLWLSVPPPSSTTPLGPGLICTYISLYLVYGNVLCMIQTLIYIYSCTSYGNKEDITMTYTIRGSVLRLTDSNLSMYTELLKL